MAWAWSWATQQSWAITRSQQYDSFTNLKRGGSGSTRSWAGAWGLRHRGINKGVKYHQNWCDVIDGWPLVTLVTSAWSPFPRKISEKSFSSAWHSGSEKVNFCYCRDPKTDHLKTRIIRKLDILNRFWNDIQSPDFFIQFSNPYSKIRPFEYWTCPFSCGGICPHFPNSLTTLCISRLGIGYSWDKQIFFKWHFKWKNANQGG